MDNGAATLSQLHSIQITVDGIATIKVRAINVVAFGYPNKDYTLYLPQFNANGQCKISFKAAGVESDNATLSRS